MREILFRGKRTDNGEWIEGAYSPFNLNFFGEREEKPHIIIISDDKNIDGLWCEVIPETVGQYTGLTDKNGVKIFEGDIVRYGTNTNRADNEEISEVVFETRGGSGYFGIRISEIETWQFCLEVPAKLMEVIGNIYDYSKLLKGGGGNG